MGRTKHGRAAQAEAMKPSQIISRAESLQILKNDLRKAAHDKRAGELKAATPERRKAILAEIEREIRAELQKRGREFDAAKVIY